MTNQLPDPRINPYRDDMAAQSLKDRVDVPAYVEGSLHQVATGLLGLYSAPNAEACLASQLLYGESFTVYEIKDGWAWGQAQKDGYVGYCPVDGLSPDLFTTSHHVSALSTHIYTEPHVKSKTVGQVFMMSELSVANEVAHQGFVELADGHWVYATHISNIAGEDPVAEALKLLYTPYLWGGRSSAGIDCSGLIQLAFAMVGMQVPRDSDMQQEFIGEKLPGDAVPERGDLAFFPGHVGFMLDDMHLLHANAHHMRVSIDPLRDVIDIISFQTDEPPLSCIKRIGGSTT